MWNLPPPMLLTMRADTPADSPSTPADLVDLYLNLLAKSVTGYGQDSTLRPLARTGGSKIRHKALNLIEGVLNRKSLTLAWMTSHDLELRAEGREMPVLGKTMVGLRRLENVRRCIEQILTDDVPGDFLEAGVWRGGTIVYMKGVLAAHGARRRVWAADSFEGLPEPDLELYPQDHDQWLHDVELMAVSRKAVEETLDQYGFLDEDVQFLEGWFKDTMPTAPVDQLSLLRLDGDYYESTIQVLDAMYDKVSPGGFILVDDYGAIPACKQAVEDFRGPREINDPIELVDWTGAYWRKSG